MENQNTNKSPLTLPGAIILAAAMITAAIIWTSRPANVSTNTNDSPKKADEVKINLTAINSNDHVLGNPNANIMLVEYSDPSCPYCKVFNPTMTTIMDSYGPSGDVAWVYRHFPLDKPDQTGTALHPNAGHEAQALECAASLGGNTKFWAFEKKLYEVTPSVTPQSPKGLDQKQLPEIAKSVGLDAVAFNDCLSSGQFKEKVDKDYLSGINAKVTGTPTSFFVLKNPVPTDFSERTAQVFAKYGIDDNSIFVSTDGKTIFMSGAMPIDVIKTIIDILISKKS